VLLCWTNPCWAHDRFPSVFGISVGTQPQEFRWLPVAVRLERKAVRFAQDVELVLLSPVLPYHSRGELDARSSADPGIGPTFLSLMASSI